MITATLDELSIGSGQYGIGAPATDYDPRLPRYLRITDIRDDGTLDLSDKKSVNDSKASSYMLRPGDIVFARTGNSTGRNYFYDKRDGEFTFAGFLIRFSLDESKVNPRYIKYYAQSKSYWNWIASFNTGSTRGNINAKTYGSMPIPLPERRIQDSIVSFCDSLSDKIRINTQINDYLAELCEEIAGAITSTDTSTLSDIAYQVSEKASCNDASPKNYVSTESLLPNKGGRQAAFSLPEKGKVTVFQPGDTLISNIRPYFKKIWFADTHGTCSGDVIVFRAKDLRFAPYIYAVLRSDRFFEYAMSGAKGTKMPRGDKKQMMQFPIAASCNNETLQVLATMVQQISTNAKETDALKDLRDVLLPKLMSGEIDVSQVDITQLNNHLAHRSLPLLRIYFLWLVPTGRIEKGKWKDFNVGSQVRRYDAAGSEAPRRNTLG